MNEHGKKSGTTYAEVGAGTGLSAPVLHQHAKENRPGEKSPGCRSPLTRRYARPA